MMGPARPWLAAALIVLAACGSSSKKKPATDAGPEGGAAGQLGGSGADGSGSGAAGVGIDAAAAEDSGADAAGAGGSPLDAGMDHLADASSDGPPRDVGVETPPPAPGSPFRALAVSTGTLHSCAILDNHGIKCWGRNTYGELGLGDTRDHGATAADMGDNLPFVDLGTGRTALAVSAGRYHTCAILDDGSVKCWGLQALTGTSVQATNGVIGDAPGEMGDHLPALELGGRKARLLASSFSSSCASFEDNTIWCWGTSPAPLEVPLDPHPDVVQLSPFHLGAIALFADATVSRTLPSNTQPVPAPPQTTTYVAGGDTTCCFVGQDGKATCSLQGSEPWEKTTGLKALGMTSDATCGLFDGGALRCWGSCGTSTPSASYWCGAEKPDHSFPVALGQPAVALTTAGGYHLCALLSDGGVKCWVMETVDCPDKNGTYVPCDVPPQDAQPTMLGASVEVVTTNNVRHYGAWREIDLGKHP
jgi:hypothetical protein